MVVLIGILMMAATVAIHSIGASRWLRFVGKWLDSHRASPSIDHLFSSVVATGLVLLLLHVVESALWAIVYWGLPAHAGLNGFGECIYFSMVTFSSLGYGDITLEPAWYFLGPMEAMVGITVFGLTTALLFAVIERCWRLGREARA